MPPLLPPLLAVLAAAPSSSAPGSSESEPETEAEPTVRTTIDPGSGIRWTAADDRFSLGLGLFAQLLHTIEHDVADEQTTQAFEFRRARLRLDGHVFGPHNRFFVQLAFSPRDLQFQDGRPTKTPIFDWFVEFDHIPDVVLRVGQFRVPFSRQRRISIAHIMMADRALANFEFNLDRDVGMSVRSPDLMGWGRLRYELGVFIGEGRDAFAPGGPGMLTVGRVEVLPLGTFSDYDETDRDRSRRPRLSLGGAYAFLAEAKGNRGILGPPPTDGGTTDTHNVTADAMLKVAGMTVLGEVYWRRGRREYGDAFVDDPVLGSVLAPREAPRDGWGWFLQAGWLVPRIPLELGTRYGFVRPSRRGSSLPPRDEVSASVGWYFHGPALKLVADYTRGWPPGSLPEGGVHQARVQLQAAF
ncbi:porin [Paraliomyxa miuraensis]|uniref:porin n=1 Tax=Paraliomyxa miuraensis TaxID=376150 RepID=UPI0022537EA2|nr:porin [Paraliomyxa miuraensis]MCX4246225.1 porin [Paraliomyxa miuraensis]